MQHASAQQLGRNVALGRVVRSTPSRQWTIRARLAKLSLRLPSFVELHLVEFAEARGEQQPLARWARSISVTCAANSRTHHPKINISAPTPTQIPLPE